MNRFAVTFFKVLKPGLNRSKNSWLKSVFLIWLQVANRLIGKLSRQALPRRHGPDSGTTNSVKLYIFPLYLTFGLATPLGIMTSPEKVRNLCISSFLESLALVSSTPAYARTV